MINTYYIHFLKLFSLTIDDYQNIHKKSQMDLDKAETSQLWFSIHFANSNINVCFEQVMKYLQEQKNKLNEQFMAQDHSDLEEQEEQQNQNIVIKALRSHNYNFNKYESMIVISNMTKKIPIQYILRQLSRQYPKKVDFYIFNSQIDNQFFNILKIISPEIPRIFINFCNIGNSLPQYVGLLNTSVIRQIQICHDPIDNRGLKKLLSFNFPQLVQLELTNLNNTCDILHNIQKLSTKRGLLKIGFHDFLHHSLTIKKIKDLFTSLSQNKQGQLQVSTSDFVFKNELCKLKLQDNEKACFNIINNYPKHLIIKNKLDSQITQNCLRRMIDFY